MVPCSPINMLEFSFHPISRLRSESCFLLHTKRLKWSIVLAAAMDLFLSTEEDFCFKRICFVIGRSRKHSLHIGTTMNHSSFIEYI